MVLGSILFMQHQADRNAQREAMQRSAPTQMKPVQDSAPTQTTPAYGGLSEREQQEVLPPGHRDGPKPSGVRALA